MRGFQIGDVKVCFDYSGNNTKGLCHDTATGKFIEQNLAEIEFDSAVERDTAQATRDRIAAEAVANGASS